MAKVIDIIGNPTTMSFDQINLEMEADPMATGLHQASFRSYHSLAKLKELIAAGVDAGIAVSLIDEIESAADACWDKTADLCRQLSDAKKERE